VTKTEKKKAERDPSVSLCLEGQNLNPQKKKVVACIDLTERVYTEKLRDELFGIFSRYCHEGFS